MGETKPETIGQLLNQMIDCLTELAARVQGDHRREIAVSQMRHWCDVLMTDEIDKEQAA